jgi:hypothetical protein
MKESERENREHGRVTASDSRDSCRRDAGGRLRAILRALDPIAQEFARRPESVRAVRWRTTVAGHDATRSRRRSCAPRRNRRVEWHDGDPGACRDFQRRCRVGASSIASRVRAVPRSIGARVSIASATDAQSATPRTDRTLAIVVVPGQP